MVSVRQAMQDAAARLTAAGVADPMRDVRKLMTFAVGCSPGELIMLDHRDLTDEESEKFRDSVKLREKRKPVAQIIGQREFFGRIYAIDETVLDPRPETETLIEVALRDDFKTVLDLGTGSGAIIVTLLAENEKATGLASDVNKNALRIAGENAKTHDVLDRLSLIDSDWWTDIDGTFDLIVSNPPYIAENEMRDLAPEVRDWEPRLALTDGGDGLAAYRAIAVGAMSHLALNGRILVEIGPTQAGPVAQIFEQSGLGSIEVHKDLDGRDRVISARR